MIGIVNYGLGNIQSFKNIFKRKNLKYIEIQKSQDLKNANCFLLPGVGSFDDAITKLKSQEYFEDLNYLIKIKKKPILGICVGMQIMFTKSEEGKLSGLDWINGAVKLIKKEGINSKKKIILPHLGWNKILILKEHPIFKDLNNNFFYFLHSYYCETSSSENYASTSYYKSICSLAIKNNIYGIQFHPEKSHKQGEKILENYYKLYAKS